MKKTIFLAAAALLMLAACDRTGTTVVGTPGEIGFKTTLQGVTKAGELSGTSFDDEGYAIYASASQYASDGLLETPHFFTDQLFMNKVTAGTGDPDWHHYEDESAADASPLYWPVGGSSMDFLAYALPKGAKAGIPAPAFNGTVAARDFTVASWDTYANQVDLLYAAANGQTSLATGTTPYIKMEFRHAQALLIFNVRINQAASGLAVNDISFVTPEFIAARNAELNGASPKAYADCSAPAAGQVTLQTRGTFQVDNQRNDLVAGWSFDAAGEGVVAANWKMPSFAGTPSVSPCNIESPAIGSAVDYGTALTENAYVQLGETLLVPQQQARNFCVTYTVGGNTMQYYYNVPRRVWQAGYKYVYNLDINLNEIIITETVVDFDRVADTFVLE